MHNISAYCIIHYSIIRDTTSYDLQFNTRAINPAAIENCLGSTNKGTWKHTTLKTNRKQKSYAIIHHPVGEQKDD